MKFTGSNGHSELPVRLIHPRDRTGNQLLSIMQHIDKNGVARFISKRLGVPGLYRGNSKELAEALRQV